MAAETWQEGKALSSPRILVLGVGNLLLGDDGVGVHLIASLAGAPLPANVQLLEAGTVSHQWIPLLGEIDRLIVVDAVEAGAAPGTIFRFSPTDVRFSSVPLMSLHQISLIDVLRLAELTGGKPETTIIGVQPRDVSSWSLALCPEVEAALPQVRELIWKEIRK